MSLESVVADMLEKHGSRFYGKYRGIVVDNRDPANLGRLKIMVPSVLGSQVVTGWATPCTPYGGATNVGFLFIPDIGAGVWTEFEEGDLNAPLWTGSFWSQPQSQTELPKPNQGSDGSEASEVQSPPTAKTIKTATGHTLQFEDADNAEMILIREGVKGHFITMDKDGVTITDANSNTIQFRSGGVTVTDANSNKIEMTSDGIKLTDASSNVIEMSSSAFTITAKAAFTIDASGQSVSIIGSSIDFQQG